MSTTKLSVKNLPGNITHEEFGRHFNNFAGLTQAHLFVNEKHEIIGVLEFSSYEFADHAKKVMQKFKFPGSSQEIVLDFLPSQFILPQVPPKEVAQPVNNPTAGALRGHGTMFGNAPQTQQISNMANSMPQMQGVVGGGYHPQTQGTPYGDSQNMAMYLAATKKGLGGQNGQGNEGPMQYGNPMVQNYHPQAHMMQPQGYMQSRPNQQMGHVMPQQPIQQQPMQQQTMQQQPQMSQMPNQMYSGPTPGYMIQTHQPQQQQSMQTMPAQLPTSSNSLSLFTIPSNATNSLYVDGVPNDSSEREVAHVFRPFPGFQRVRLIRKTARSGRRFFFCFVDFDNTLQATIALTTLQVIIQNRIECVVGLLFP
eukprot:TRINITY_DN2621_c0_g1_i5.p1 TRINITY_DN2621_c0_g1~~TRINITY_DN2621_c0_g1_i5.p1  ORF type:complete len:366 (-),score=31.15 TRINITY_DN2621_c0_g1_i5:231-1328(-)